MRDLKATVPVALIMIFLGWLIIPALFQDRPATQPARPQLPTLTNADIFEAAETLRSREGWPVKIEGQIASDPQYDQEGTHIQLRLVSGEQEADVIVRYPANVELMQGDYVRVVGSVAGTFSGETGAGEPVEILEVKAGSIDPVEPEIVLAPARAVWHTASRQGQRGVEVGVDRIEFASSETRLYLTVRNTGGAAIVVQVSNSFIKQQGRLFEPSPDLPRGYKEMSVDLSAGSAGSGALVFPPLDESAALNFSLAVSGPDWEESFDFILRAD